MIIPILTENEKNDKIISRFLAKVAVEALLKIFIGNEDFENNIYERKDLIPIKEYARFGKGKFWKYHQYRFYS